MHAIPGCPEDPSRRLHPGVLPPLPAHLGSSCSPWGDENSKKSTSPRRCWTGAARAGICLPRGAHAAPGCPEAPSRRLHPGVLPPLPAHLGSSCSPWIVFHNFCFLGCCSHIGSSRFFGGCIVLGLSQSCVLMPTRFDALSDFRIVLICRKHFE